MEGIKITPEMIEKMKAAKSPEVLIDLCKSEGIELDEKAAEKWFAMLNSNELAAKELSVVADKGGCGGSQKCPQCGSNRCWRRYYSTGLGTGVVYVHCEDCGYTKEYV